MLFFFYSILFILILINHINYVEYLSFSPKFRKFDEIKKYRLLQFFFIQAKDMKWSEIVDKFYDRNDEEADISFIS